MNGLRSCAEAKQVTNLNLTFFCEPEVLSSDASFTLGLRGGAPLNGPDEAIDPVVDRGILMVGTHLLLGITPHGIQGLQRRTPLRQPQQAELQLPRQTGRGVRRVTRVFVLQQPHLPTPIVVLHPLQERPEILAPLAPAWPQQPVPRPHRDRPEHHPPGVPPAARHLRRLPPPGPARPQRREPPP